MPLRNAVFVVVGTIMGSGVSPQVIETARLWPQSFVVLAISLAFVMATSSWLLGKYFRQDKTTAVLSSAPGHLSFVLGLGAETGGNLTTISVVQSIRLLCLTLAVPAIISWLGYQEAPLGSSQSSVPDLLSFVIMLAGCAIAGFVLSKTRLPAAWLIGPMLVSTIAHITGWIEGAVPLWMAIPAYVVMGALIGTRFSSVSMSQLAANAGAGLTTTLVAVMVSSAAALLASELTGLPIAATLVAFAPGGVETMSAMAMTVNADPAYVAAHHVLRLFILTAMIPVFLRAGLRR